MKQIGYGDALKDVCQYYNNIRCLFIQLHLQRIMWKKTNKKYYVLQSPEVIHVVDKWQLDLPLGITEDAALAALADGIVSSSSPPTAAGGTDDICCTTVGGSTI